MITTTEVRQRLDRREHFIRKFREAHEKYPWLNIRTMLSNDSKVAKNKNKDDAKAWNLPLHKSCCAKGSPIASWTCRSLCYCFGQYADRGEILYPKQARAYRISKLPEFSDVMIGAILDAAVPCFRLHSFGDFFSQKYIAAWVRTVEECDGVQFLAYTRSWRVPEWIPTLKQLAELPNMNLFLSYDRDTGEPPEIHGTGWAWLASTDNDAPPKAPPIDKPFVIFRGTDEASTHRPPRRRYYTLRQIGGDLGGYYICPHEDGKHEHNQARTIATVDCVTCKHCLFKGRRRWAG